MRWPWEKLVEHDEENCPGCRAARSSMLVHVEAISGGELAVWIGLNADAPAVDPKKAARAIRVALGVHLDRVLGTGRGENLTVSGEYYTLCADPVPCGPAAREALLELQAMAEHWGSSAREALAVLDRHEGGAS